MPPFMIPKSRPYDIEGSPNLKHGILSIVNQVSVFLSCESQAADD
jgi:hypothetical protein